MPQAVLHGLDVHVVDDELSGLGVAQLVELEAAEPVVGTEGAPSAAGVDDPEVLGLVGAADQCVVAQPHGSDVSYEALDQRALSVQPGAADLSGRPAVLLPLQGELPEGHALAVCRQPALELRLNAVALLACV